MRPTRSPHPSIPVGHLRRALQQVPDDHALIPSRVYTFYIVDKDGHNLGYVSGQGDVKWWPAVLACSHGSSTVPATDSAVQV